MKAIVLLDQLLEKLSRYGLILSLFSILALSVGAIVLRWSGESFMWVEPLTRHLVFLSAFLGGSLATSKGVHIKVDLLHKILERSRSKFLQVLHRNLISFFCLLTCMVLFKSSWDFYQMEKEFGAPAFLDIHSSWLVAIIPAGVGLICLRFFNQLLINAFIGETVEHHRL